MNAKNLNTLTIVPLVVLAAWTLKNKDRFEAGWQRQAVTYAAYVGGAVGVYRAYKMFV